MNKVYTPQRITRDVESNMAGHQCPELVRHSLRICLRYLGPRVPNRNLGLETRGSQMRKKEVRKKKVGGGVGGWCRGCYTDTLGWAGVKTKSDQRGAGEDLETRCGSRSHWDTTPTLETSAHKPCLASIVRIPCATDCLVDSRIKCRPLFR